jgi:hypothetical protein
LAPSVGLYFNRSSKILLMTDLIQTYAKDGI